MIEKRRRYSAARTDLRSARIGVTKGAAYRRGQLWYAIRVLRRFTVQELLSVTEQTNKHSALVFLAWLRKGGFVRAQYGNRGKHELTQFHLIRNSGPKCPALLKRGTVVYDHNTGQEYPINGTQ